MDIDDQKAEARKASFARRKAAHAARPEQWWAPLQQVMQPYFGRPMAGYMPIRTEIDPRPVMAQAAMLGPVGIPVIDGAGLPLRFAKWTPDTELVEGAFGAMIPATPQFFEPEVLIVPLVAFDRRGGRLGYGGGFYDRSLEGLRAKRPTIAIGYAYGAQQMDAVPLIGTDQPLDFIVTETEIIKV